MEGRRGGARERVLWGAALGLTSVLVTVSAVLAVFRAVQHLLPSRPDPTTSSAADPAPPSSPSPPAAGPNPTNDLRLPGAGRSVVYVQADAAVYRVDLATGELTRTLTPDLTQFSSIVAGPGWLVSKTVDADTGVVVRDGQPAAPLPSGLRGTGRVYPAAGERLWLVPEMATNGYRTATQVDLDGHRVGKATIQIPDEFGVPGSDLDGQLLVLNAGGAYRAGPDGLHRLATGQLLASGTRYVLTWSCDDRGRCNTYRTDRATGQATVLRVNHEAVLDLYQGDQDSASGGQGVVSPDGTHAALAVSSRGPVDRPLAVVNLSTGDYTVVPGSLAGSNPNAQVAWTANSRWLLALTDNQLRAYDTTTRTIRTLKTRGEPLQHLLSTSAAGF